MFGYHLLCIVIFFDLGISQMMGPADLQIKSVESSCPDKGPYQSWIDMTYHRINRTTEVFDINATFTMWMDDQVGVYLSIEKLLDGGYKKVYEMRDDNACELLMKYAPQHFTEMLRLAGLEEKCPIPPGSYLMQNYIFNFEKIPRLPYGSFILEPEGVKDGRSILCFRMHFDIKPKDSTRYLG